MDDAPGVTTRFFLFWPTRHRGTGNNVEDDQKFVNFVRAGNGEAERARIRQIATAGEWSMRADLHGRQKFPEGIVITNLRLKT